MIVVPKNKAETVLMAQWACDILQQRLELFGFDRNGEPMFEALGFSRDGEMLCVCVAYQYTRPNVFMAFAAKSPRWASRENIKALGIWIIEGLKCNRVTTLTAKHNKRSRRFQEGIGFKHEGKLRKATNNDDIIIYGLTKTDHHAWLRKAFNGPIQQTRSRTAA
jgi:hypothetical protein